MSYISMKNKFFENINLDEFKELVENKKYTCREFVVEQIDNITKIIICYPGYKTKLDINGNKYDYRVDLSKGDFREAISHANIIVDLYNKAVQLKGKAEILINLLHDIAINGNIIDKDKYLIIEEFKLNTPSDEFLKQISLAHKNIGKSFNTKPNQYNFSFNELVYLISWIVLQEDINYPMPRYEGRRMSFYRYLEIIYCAMNPKDKLHSIELVIQRALSHSRPPLWQDIIDYSIIKNLNA